jgi:hypothetical protein
MKEATYGDWLDRTDVAFEDPSSVPTLDCPRCGHKRLQFRIVIYNEDRTEGHGVMWCENCLHGIALGPCTTPAGAVVVAGADSGIARFTLIPP